MYFKVFHEDASQSTEASSPGPVKPYEILLRLGFHPEHMENGKILPSAITRKDLKDSGFSVDRKEYVTRETIELRALEQMPKKPRDRKTALISSFSCHAVRSLMDESGKRALLVIDQAILKNPAHACIYSAYEKGDGGLKKIKNLLLPLLQDHIVLDDFIQANPDIN